MKVVAFMPAKGSSSRVENKNLRLLDGKPLFLHTLEKLMACDFIDEVYLDTESEEMIAMAAETGCRVLRRDPRLASNSVDGNALFRNEVAHVAADIYMQILCTSPFIKIETLRRAVSILRDPGSAYDSVVLVRREKLYTWQDGRPVYDIERIPNSVDLPETIIETMGLYVMRREAAIKLGRRIGDHPYLLEASPMEAVDVNWPEDLELANLIAAGGREQERKLFNNLRHHLTSSLLSDLLDDAGYREQVVRGLISNLPGSKLIGRAKTLRLRRLREGEDYRGIYRALESYKTIVPGDVIVVENEVGDHAYFGELNANLALRAGAVGAIIDGMTRDSKEVADMGYTVFSRGYTCQDVRKRATVDAINVAVRIGGVRVAPGDLVYADSEGIVIVPRKVEQVIIQRALENAIREKRLLLDVAQGMDAEVLTEKYGFF